MSTPLRLLPQPEPDEWDSFVESHAAGHILQTAGWGALKSRFGWWAERVALACIHSVQIQSGALLLFRRTLGLTAGYVPRGPLVDWRNRNEVEDTLETLRGVCRRHGASLLKLEPELPDTPANRTLLTSFGLRPSRQTVQPRSTIHFDLTGSEDDLLARMKSKWRYNVRLSQKKGVTVRTCAAADLPAFNALMADTAARDAFDVHDPAYYSAAFDLLGSHAAFLLAEADGVPIAALVVCAVGTTAWYLWGASSDRERNRMPNHALQWAAMRWARERGALTYDFWGIPDELGEVAQGLNGGDGSGTPAEALPVDLESFPREGLWGVYRFKQGFGGQVVRTVGAWDLPVRPLGFAVYQAGLTALALKSTAQARLREAGRAGGPSLTPITSPAEWRSTLAAIPGGEPAHVLQSWEWGEIKAQTGWVAERLTVDNGVAALQFLTRRPMPGLPLQIAYVPKGPVLDWSNAGHVRATLDALQAHARARRCLLVKIDPDVDESAPHGQALVAELRRRGWIFSNEQVQFKNTGLTDLTPGADALLEAMKSKSRYNVRLAAKRGITVREGSQADFDTFYALYAETAARDGFLIRPAAYYNQAWSTFLRAQAEPGNPAGGALLLAEHPEEPTPVAGLFLLRYANTAWYFYGASSDRRRRDMPNALLQFEAMRWAADHGCTRYDWWGAPDDLEDSDDRLQGVWAFKEGLGAVFAPHIGAWDYPVSPALYGLYTRLLPRVLDLMRKSAGSLSQPPA